MLLLKRWHASVVTVAFLPLACGFHQADTCPGYWPNSPCWRYLSPAQLAARNYQHIVAISYPALSSTPRGGSPSDRLMQDEQRAIRDSLARGFREVLQDSAIGQRLSFDSGYLADAKWLGVFPPVGLADSSWRSRWPHADAVLEIRHVRRYGSRYCASGSTWCQWLEVYLVDAATDSAVWRADFDLYATHPKGAPIIGSWMSEAIVDQLRADEVLPLTARTPE